MDKQTDLFENFLTLNITLPLNTNIVNSRIVGPPSFVPFEKVDFLEVL